MPFLSTSMTSYYYWLQVTSSGWPFVLTVPGLMTYLVACLTLDSARSYVMQGASFTHGKASSIPIVFIWGGSISLDGFLPSILLLVVIIVVVVIVVVMVILVVVVVKGWTNEFHQDIASSVRVPVAHFTLQSSVQLLRRNTDSVRSNQQMRPTVPFVPLKLKGARMDIQEKEQKESQKQANPSTE
ncbi:hypothetical protein Tco_1087047 [Tanacetum coccineum]